MRTAFHEQLDSLTEMLSNMCGLAGLAMDRATQALLQADLAMAEQVFTDHDQLAHMQTSAEEAAFRLLALQSPVAGDLRICRWFLTETRRTLGRLRRAADSAGPERQENRDRVSLEDDRRRAAETKGRHRVLARELAALRLAVGRSLPANTCATSWKSCVTCWPICCRTATKSPGATGQRGAGRQESR